jgi:hypothetical protein
MLAVKEKREKGKERKRVDHILAHVLWNVKEKRESWVERRGTFPVALCDTCPVTTVTPRQCSM